MRLLPRALLTSAQRPLPIRHRVDGFGIPDVVSFEDLVRHVGEHRGTTIRFLESSALDGADVCGLWVGNDAERVDTIFLPESARPEMKLVVACHELGHMLDTPTDGPEEVDEDPELLAYVAEFLPVHRRVDRLYARATFSDEREAAAEAIGDQLALRLLRGRRQSAVRDFQFERVFR